MRMTGEYERIWELITRCIIDSCEGRTSFYILRNAQGEVAFFDFYPITIQKHQVLPNNTWTLFDLIPELSRHSFEDILVTLMTFPIEKYNYKVTVQPIFSEFEIMDGHELMVFPEQVAFILSRKDQ